MRVLAVLILGCTAPTIAVGELPPAKTSETLRVESWDVSRLQWNAPHAAAMTDAIARAVAAAPIDVLCLTSMPSDEDAARVIEGGKTAFPHAVRARLDRETPVTDPRDLFGNVPASATTPPCAESDRALFDEFAACFAKECTRPDGAVIVGCGPQRCAAALAAPSPRCGSCAETAAVSGPLEKNACFTHPRGELAHNGRSSVVLLSKRPLREPKTDVLVGTLYRPTLTHATIDTEIGPIDVACAEGGAFGFHRTVYSTPYNASKSSDPNASLFYEMSLAVMRMYQYAYAQPHPVVLLGVPGLQYDVRSDGALNTMGWYRDVAANFHPIVSPETFPMCTHCAEATSTDKLAVRGLVASTIATRGFASVEVLELTRAETEVVHTLDGKPSSASGTYAERATLKLNR